MKKNNYIVEYEKRMANLKKKIVIDSAYIGAGFVLALSEENLDDEVIERVMARTNEIWVKLADEGINPLRYCEEKTGYVLLTEQQEIDIVNEYFEDDKYE